MEASSLLRRCRRCPLSNLSQSPGSVGSRPGPHFNSPSCPLPGHGLSSWHIPTCALEGQPIFSIHRPQAQESNYENLSQMRPRDLPAAMCVP